jgi:EmrB/QacA subfamily drug resistance transporter
VACGIAQNPGELIAARVVQAVGGALLTPQTLTIIIIIFPPGRRGAALGVWGSVIGLSAVAGPTLGGVLVTEASWRWIFFVNLPIGLITLLGTLRLVPSLQLGRAHRMDWPGVAGVTVGLFLVVFGLVEGQRYHWGAFWGPVTIPDAMIAGAVVLAGLLVWERHATEPLLPGRLFRRGNYSALIAVQSLIAFGMLGLFLPMVLLLQSALGLSALRAGLTLLPFSLASSVSAPVAGQVADRIGAKYLLITGIALFALGLALTIAATSPTAHQASFLLPMVIGGFGLGMCLSPLPTEAMRQVEPQLGGTASGVLNGSRQVGGLIGTAVITAVLQGTLSSDLARHARATAAALRLPAGLRDQFARSFSLASADGLRIAPGQSVVRLPAGLPASQAASLTRAVHEVLAAGLVDAVRATLWVPVAVVTAAALCCLVVKSRSAPAAGQRRIGRPPATQRRTDRSPPAKG